MRIYPAIDLRDGRVVRLDQGDYGRETRYADDPLLLAQRYCSDGAQWLHVVDLDGARSGAFTALDSVERLARESGLLIQCGGGVRSEQDVERLLAAGATRVVVGSVAVREPARIAQWMQRFGAEHLCIALDARTDADGVFRLPVSGWTETTGVALFDWIERAQHDMPLHDVLCTDIDRDGMLGGANVDLYAELAKRFPQLALQASGGVRGVEDVQALRRIGVAGAIVGKALLEARVSLGQLLQ